MHLYFYVIIDNYGRKKLYNKAINWLLLPRDKEWHLKNKLHKTNVTKEKGNTKSPELSEDEQLLELWE